ncbi:MAG: adenosine kinase [Candidatus Puniceispirillaceae bacterium]
MSLDVIYVGNAIVDMVCVSDDAFLATHDIEKGGMNLIDEARAVYLSDHLINPTKMAGGSAANSAVGMALLGGNSGYIGEVAQDSLGAEFVQSLEQTGTKFLGKQTNDGLATARSMIIVTPDAVRSMNTFLGACIQMGPSHLTDMPLCDVFYLEGYLFDAPQGPALFDKVADIAAQTGAKLALSLSDAWCVERHFDALSAFIKDHVSILFSNEDEARALTGKDYVQAGEDLRHYLDEVIITRGAQGAYIIKNDEIAEVQAQPIGKVVDTTGAGDLFAAGYLFARSKGKDAKECGLIASALSGEIICHYGARPESDLKALITHLLAA